MGARGKVVIMGYRSQALFEQPFTDATRVVIFHNLDLEYTGVRVLINEEVAPETLFAVGVDEDNPTNTTIVYFRTAQTGIVQIVNFDVIPLGVQSSSLLAIQDQGFSLLFGTDYNYIEDQNRITTTSTTFVQRLRLTVDLSRRGNYRISTSFTWDLDNVNRDILARLELDDSRLVWEFREEPTDPAITQQRFAMGTEDLIIPSDGIHTVDLDFAVSSPPATAGIDQAKIEFWRF